jgi:3-oxoacyl-[acyl-carrier-protein] synthase-3
VLFGDGAGAVVVKAGDGMYQSYLKSEGKSGAALLARGLKNNSPFAVHADDEAYAKYKPTTGHCLAMEGREVYRFATKAMSETLEIACKKAGITVSDLDLIIPHQANIRIIKTAAERLGVSMDKMYVNVDRYGNTSCASIPICIDELNVAGRLHRGDKIALAGFGGGLTCGAIVMEW